MKKDYIYGGVVLVVLALLVFQLFNNPIKEENNVAELIKLDREPPEKYVDPTGKTHVVKQVIYLKDEQAVLLYRAQLDSVTKQLAVKDKHIAGLTTIAGQAEHEFNAKIESLKDELNNVTGSKIDYTSEWFDLKGTVDAVSNTSKFKATFRDSITIAFVKKKKGFLGFKEKIYADAYSSNPDMKLTNIRSWEVPQARNNKAKIGFGATAGYGLQLSKQNTISHGFQITGGLQFRF